MKKASYLSFSKVLSLIIGMSFANISLAVPILLEATIDGAQASAGAGTGSAATGSASMMYEESTGLFSWEVEWSGLPTPALVAHFHGAATPAQNAGVQVSISVLTSPTSGQEIINAAQATDLLAGLWYINIHTSDFFGGEIRGQVLRSDTAVPVPSSIALVLLAMAGVITRRKARQ